MLFLKYFSILILKIFGWKRIGDLSDYKKAVLVVAPHTSMFDSPLGWLLLNSIKKKSAFLVKESYFWFPFGILMRILGGIPVSKSSAKNMITSTAKEIKRRDSVMVAITPEATRKPVAKWQRGFYYIAMKAEVPIILVYMDYEKKEAGVGPIIWPSGNLDADMITIKKFYMDKKGRHPERFTTGLTESDLA